ncbi:hypothetical protein [Azospirillum halopraeferens]|uniref:hypothetical protein n=1 Tax=Azospirillum halopraeferens TaxID=34010 RepID=UPI000A053130|nr:hypothetical protein [Azospirillum halopraeferens]
MLRLGTKVRLQGQEALIVARTLVGTPRYDVRLADGRLVKYAVETDFEWPAGDGHSWSTMDAGGAPR